MIALVHDEHVGDLQNAGLEHLHRIARTGLQRDEHRVGDLRDLDLRLPDADRFDDHHVETERIHQRHRIGGRAGDAAEMSATRHRPDEHARIDEVLGEANAIAE